MISRIRIELCEGFIKILSVFLALIGAQFNGDSAIWKPFCSIINHHFIEVSHGKIIFLFLF